MAVKLEPNINFQFQTNNTYLKVIKVKQITY